MGYRVRRPRRRVFLWQVVFLGAGVVLIVVAIGRLTPYILIPDLRSATNATLASGITPTMPASLTRRDVLPTPTFNVNAPRRAIIFPAAALTSPIIESIRTENTWETRYLGSNVGHLEGTSWLDGIGGNIVLAGHVESETGAPGPFAHLFQANIGDPIILQEGDRQMVYQVMQIERVPPTAVEYIAQDGNQRLTLITCTDWDFERQTYDGRLIVIAQPLQTSQGLVLETSPTQVGQQGQ